MIKIKKISYLVPPTDLIDDCLDVFVSLENDDSYIVKVTTPKCISGLMKESESGFLPPGYPYIIVSRLTDEIIHAAIQSFIDTKADSYWLKLYHIITTLKIENINEILDKKEKEEI